MGYEKPKPFVATLTSTGRPDEFIVAPLTLWSEPAPPGPGKPPGDLGFWHDPGCYNPDAPGQPWPSRQSRRMKGWAR